MNTTTFIKKTGKNLLLMLFLIVLSFQAKAQPSDGDGTIGDPYQIATLTDLKWIADQVNGGTITFSGEYLIQTANIDASSTSSGAGWVAIGAEGTGTFSGNYDGQGYTISNLYINNPSANYYGLWGYCDDATIKNLGVTNVSIVAGDDVGGLAGYMDSGGTISNCYVTGSVKSTGSTGYVGGLCGESFSNVDNCFAGCTVVAENGSAGGLIANFATANLTYSYSSGSVTVNSEASEVGGLLGTVSTGSSVENCFSESSVSTNGVLHREPTNPDFSNIGGLIGTNQGTVVNCYANGSITILNAENESEIGGLLGGNTGTVSYSYSTCSLSVTSVTGNTPMVGGFVGMNYYQNYFFFIKYSSPFEFTPGTVNNNCYWNSSLYANGCGSNSYTYLTLYTATFSATGKTTAEMKEQTTFTGWDFLGESANGTNDYWNFISGRNSDYPVLILPPRLTTKSITTYGSSSATMGGDITNDGNGATPGRGIVYSLSTANTNPTIGGTGVTQVANAATTNDFSASITGLSANKTYYVRAYATNSKGTSYGSARSFTTLTANNTPAIAVNNATLAYTENAAATQTDAAATLSDADGDADWNGGKLEVQITANNEAADEISIPDNIIGSINTSGTSLRNSSTAIGTLSASEGTVTSGTKLTITFNASATNALVQQVLRVIHYRNTSDNPGTSNRTITFTATDKNAASASDTRTVSITAVNDEPTLTATGTSPIFTEESSAVDLYSSITISPIESGQTISELKLTVTNVNDGSNEILAIDGSNVALTNGNSVPSTLTNSMAVSVSVTGTTATVTISKAGGISAATMQTLVDGMTYRNTSENPNISSRAVTLTSIKDNGGTANSGDDTATLSVASTVAVVATNDAPTLTAFTGVVETTNQNTAVEITLAELKAQGNEADVDGTVDAFFVTAVSTGTLKIGASAGAATAYNSSTNKTIDVTNNAYWTPASNDYGAKNAFTVTAKDNNGAESTGAVQATVQVNDVTNPSVSSITLSGSPVATASSITFVVAFNESVTNVSTDDFSLTTTGTASGTIASVSSASGTSINVTVNTISGTGTLRLDLKASTNIADNSANTPPASFTSGSIHTVDRDNPTLSSSVPVDGATGISASANITLTFSENIVFGTGNIQIIDLDDNTGTITIDAASPGSQASISNNVLTLNPTSDLEENTNYAIQIAATAIDDSNGNSYAGIANNTTLNFTSADLTAPLLSSSTPADNTANAYLGQDIVLTFNDNMVKGTGNITVKKSDGTVFEQIDVTDSKITVSGTQVTINPAGTFAKGTGYYIEIDATALDDDAGNSFAGISGSTTLNYTTVNVLINEVVTEPWQDWSTNNFNGTVAVGAVTDYDEWLELLINSSGINLTGWTIELLDGSGDITGSLAASGAFVYSSYVGTGSFTNTGSGDYLVLGRVNGGANNNNITINLKDPSGAIVDAVTFNSTPSSNSDTQYNETAQRFPNGTDTDVAGDWTQGQASMGAANTGPSVTLSVNNATIAEAAGTSTITATLCAKSSQTTTVNLSTSGTGTSVTDYSLSSTSISISAGSLTGTATITSVQDTKDEDDETVIVDISSVTNGTEAGTQQQTVTITDDDEAPMVTLSVSPASIAENDTPETSTITATLSAVSAKTVTVTIAATSAAAVAGTDYSLASSTITINPGNSTGTTTLSSIQDTDVEGHQTINVDITGVTNGTENDVQQKTITLLDDDLPKVTLSQSVVSFAEAAGTNTITATLDATFSEDAVITIGANASSTATGGGTDYSLSSTTITILAGNTTGTATITAVQDLLDETNETVIIDVISCTNSVENVTQQVTSTITDDDVLPSVTTVVVSVYGNTSATLGGNVTSAGSETVSARGVVYSSSDNTPTIGESGVTQDSNGSGTGVFSESIGSLSFNTTYYVQAYATSSVGTVYGGVQNFTTTYPEINIKGNSNSIADEDTAPSADDHTDFGSVAAASGTIVKTFSIENTGTGLLTLGANAVSISGTNADDFSVTTQPATTVSAVSSVTFQVTFDPSGKGTRTATLSIANDDSNENPYNYSVQGIGANSTPTDISLSASSVNENVAGNTAVGTLSTTDADTGDSHTYTLVSGTGDTDNASFNISGSSLRITNSPDYETRNSYSVRVQTSDGSNTYSESFTITISNVNESPTDITLSASSVNENVAGNTTVGTLSTTDPDAGSSFTYTLVSGTGDTDNASFNISGSSLRITNSPDYETRNSYSVRVQTSDGSNTYSESFTITISNVNESPTDITLSASSVNENVSANTTIGTMSTTDPDAGSSFTYTLVSGTGDTDNASFNISGSSLRITNSPDYETRNSYSVRVQTSDGSNTYSESFTITISNVNESPTDITLSASSVNENVAGNTTVGTLSTTDPDAGSSFTYTLVSGTGDTDNASFNISGSSLRITNSPDYETRNSYSVRVQTSDGSNTYSESFTITISNVNESPTDITLSASSVNENVSANTTIGTMSTTDPDAGSSFTYTLVSGTGDTDNASFNISGSSLRITNSPDYETRNSYSVRVQTSDGSNTYSESFTITISNVNESPTDITLSASSVNENVAGNTTVGTLSTTDPDAGSSFTYTLVSGTGDTDNASFNISGSSLRITNSPDYETRNSYSVRVQTSDGSNTYSESFTITISNVNESPTDITLSASSVNENVAGNTTVGTLSTTDPDAGSSFTYTLVSGTGDTDNASFNISGSSLRITNSPDYETRNSYSVRVQTSDGSNTYSESFTITISNVNESPTVSGLVTDVTVTEDVASNVDLSAASFGDVDGDALVVTLTSSGGIFTAVSGGSVTVGGSGTGTLTLSGTSANLNSFLDTPANVQYTSVLNQNGENAATFTVHANDGTVNPLLGTVNIDITAVNDNPAITGLLSDITVFEDVAGNVDLSAATITDVDAGSGNVTLAIAAGTGTMSASSGGSVIVLGSGSGTLMLSGTVSNIDTYLNTASNIKYTGASNVNGNNATTITLTANDGGNSGLGGGANVLLGIVNIDITAINDEPSFTVGPNKTVAQNAGAQSVANFITNINDGDAEVAQTVSFNVSNDNTALFTSQPAISSSGTLTFTPDATKFGKATATVFISDDGGTSNGGDNQSSNQTFKIFVTPLGITINELNSYSSTDEFVELFNVNGSPVNLNGLVLVFFNGDLTNDATYKTSVDFDGYTIASKDFFVVGDAVVANLDLTWSSTDIQDGPDAVALYVGDQSDFPNGTSVTGDGLVDAIVYGSSDDAVLRATLGGISLYNENVNSKKDTESLSRWPDGTGNFGAQAATPGVTNDVIPPTVISVSSSTANGTYKIGDVVAVTVTFSENVSVTGTPTLTLNSGGTASHASGSGTTTLTYSYTVGSGHSSSDLDYSATNSLSLGDGTIKDTVGNDATLTLPSVGGASSLGGQKGIVIDGVAPTVSSVSSSTANGSYKTGDVVAVTVIFSESVSVTGTPTLTLNSGGTASYASGSGTTTLTFNYTVGSGDSSADLDYPATNSLALNSGTIKDAVGNNAILPLPTVGGANSLGGQKDIVIDGIVPLVTNVTSTKTNGTYGIGEAITITVTFSEAVTVTGTPQLELETGPVDRTINYSSGTGTNILSFTYTTQSGDESSDLDYKATGSLALNSGTIKDAAGNNATLTLSTPGAAGSLGANKAIVIQAFPTVTLSVGSSSIAEDAGTSTITATLSQTSSQAVTVSLSYSGTATNGTDYNNTASTSITVPAGSLSANVATGITAINDTDPEGNQTIVIDIVSVTKGFEEGVQQQTITIVDDDAPTITSVSVPSDGIYRATQNLDFTVTFNQPVTINTGGGTPYIPVTIGSATVNATLNGTVAGSTTALFRYTVQTGQEDTNGITVGSAVSVNGSTIRNAAGLDAITTLNSVGSTTNVKVDAIVPVAPVVTGISTDSNTAADGITSDNTLLINGTSEPNATVEVFINTVSAGTTAANGTGNWQFDHTGTVLPDGNYSLTAKATDAAGNTSAASTAYSVTVTTSQPTVAITGNVTSPANATFIAIFTFSESIYNFAIGDITVGNGAVSNFAAASAKVYTATITPVSDGSVTIDIAAGVANNLAGNTNTAATRYSITYDTVKPALAISSTAENSTNSSFMATYTFSEPVTGFTIGDIILTNATAVDFRAINTIVYTTEIIPSSNGPVTVLVEVGSAIDAASNGNLVSNKLSLNYDTVKPAVVITGTNINQKARSFTAEFTFSEPVIDFAASDIVLSNGTIANFISIGSTYYKSDIINITEKQVHVDLAAGAVHDDADNTNIQAEPFTVEFDYTAPTVLCKDIQVFLDQSGKATITAADIDNGSTDASGLEKYEIDKSSFTCANVGVNTVKLTVTDKAGNSAACNATVTVEDPITVLTKDITVLLDANNVSTISAAQIDNGSFNLCGIASYSLDKTVFDCSTLGVNTVTLTVTDNRGKTNKGTARITVQAVNKKPSFSPVSDIVVLEDIGHFEVTINGIQNGDCNGVAQRVQTVLASSTSNLIEKIDVAYVTGQATAKLTIYVKGNMSGKATVKVEAKDDGGTSNNGSDTYSSEFAVTVSPVNDAPIQNGSIDPQLVLVGTAYNFTIPVNLFYDIDPGDELTYSVKRKAGTDLPSWLSFNPASKVFSGTPGDSDKGNVLIELTATDKSGEKASTYFEIIVYQVTSSSITGNLYDRGTKLSGGAVVALYQKVDAVPTPVFNLVTRTTVSSLGSFGFYNLSAGNYILEACIVDALKYENLMTTYFDKSDNWTTSKVIQLGANANQQVEITMLEKPVQASGSFIISGFIVKKSTNTTKSGLIEKSMNIESGTPLAGVNVLLKQGGKIICACISGENGHYEFNGLPQGIYQVEVMLPGFIQQEVVAVEMNAQTTKKENVDFTVWEGNNVITDLELYLQPVHVKVYPNPTSGNLTVGIQNRQTGVSEIRVYSITGQLILEKTDLRDNNTVIDLSGHDPGIYLVKITTGQNQQTHRVVLK